MCNHRAVFFYPTLFLCKQLLTIRIRKHRSRPETGSGSAPGLPTWFCSAPAGRKWVSPSATFLRRLQQQQPRSERTKPAETSTLSSQRERRAECCRSPVKNSTKTRTLPKTSAAPAVQKEWGVKCDAVAPKKRNPSSLHARWNNLAKQNASESGSSLAFAGSFAWGIFRPS